MTITDLYINLFGKEKIKDGNVIDLAEHGRVGGLSTGQPFKFNKEVDMARKIVVSGAYTYIAQSYPGADQADAVWQVQRIDESVGGTTLVTWADGNANFDNVASNLAGLTYS